MRVFRERAGVISARECWVAIDRPWMYTADTLLGLLWVVVREWRNDKHLVG